MKYILKWTVTLILGLGLQAFEVFGQGQPNQPKPATAAILNGGTDNTHFATALSLAGWTGGGGGGGGVTTNQVFHPAQYGGLAFWFSARSLAGYTNGQAVTQFTDLSGQGNHFAGANLSYVGQVGNGEGGIYFGQQFYPVSCMASNSTILASNPGINTNCTIVIVYQSDQRNINQPSAQGGQIFNSSPRGTAGFGILDNDATGTGLDLLYATNQTWNLSKNYDGKPVVLTIRFQNNTLETWMNGVPQMISSIGPRPGGLGLAGNLYLGDFHNTSWYTWNGSISELMIFTNALSTPQIHAANAYFTQAMGVHAMDTVFLGDSITTGIQTTNGALWKDFILGTFPQFESQNCNLAGLTSGQIFTNVQQHVGVWRTRPGYHIAHVYTGVNDNANGIAVSVTETNLLNLNTMLKTNGFSLAVGTLMSQLAADTNGYRSALNTWITANSNQFAVVIPYHAITALGTNGACSNAVYFVSDYTHPTAAAYNLTSNTLASGLQYVVSQLNGVTPLVNGGGLTNLPATNVVGVLPQTSIPYAAPLGIYFTSPYTNNVSYYVPPPYSGASSSTIGSYQCFCPAGFSGHITNCIICQTVNNLGVGTNISVWVYTGPSQGTLLGTLNGAAAANQITNCVCNFAIANATNIWCVGLSNNTPAGFGPSLHASAYLQVSP